MKINLTCIQTDRLDDRSIWLTKPEIQGHDTLIPLIDNLVLVKLRKSSDNSFRVQVWPKVST